MGYLKSVLGVLSFLYAMISHADIIITSKTQEVVENHAPIVLIPIVVGIVILILVAYYLRKKK